MAGRILLDIANPSLDANGKVDAGATLTFYENGTTTLQSVYTDATLATPLANPLPCDAAGRFVPVWAANGLAYSVAWSPTGAAQITFDNITPLGDSGSSASTEFYTNDQAYATPMAADAAATAAGGALIFNSHYALTADTTFNAPIVRFSGAALLTRGAHVLTFNGIVDAPETQIFDVSATPVTFSKYQAEIKVAWFGVKADDFLHMYGNPVNPFATDDTVAWEAAYASEQLLTAAAEIIWPKGVSKVSANLFCASHFTTVGSNDYGLTGVKQRGHGPWSSVMQSYLATGTMLTIGDVAPPAVVHGNNGFSISNLGFSSAGTETLLVEDNYCRNFAVENCAFIGGNDMQLNLGRSQDVYIAHNSFDGYTEVGTGGFTTYKTSGGVAFVPDLTGAVAGPSFMHHNLVKDFRNSTHTAYGVKILAGGGHRIESNEIGNNDISLDDEFSGNLIAHNRFESSGIHFTATQAGGNVGNGTVSFPAGATITQSSAYAGGTGYIFTFTSATTASVIDPNGAALAAMTVGTPYVVSGLNFLFTAGSIPWAAGDIETLMGAGDSCLLVGATTRVSEGQYILNRFSPDNAGNLPMMNFVSFSRSTVDGNYFVNPIGVVAYFSADNNNEAFSFVQSEGIDCRLQVSDLGLNGKMQAHDNIENTGTPYWAQFQAGPSTPTTLATTPNVRNLKSADTNNAAGAVSITNFLGGYNGMSLTLRIRDNNTTIVHGGSIFLLNGANTTFSSGDVMLFVANTFVSVGGAPVWVQIPYYVKAPVPAAGGTITVASGSANNATTTGWIELSPGVNVPYIINTKP